MTIQNNGTISINRGDIIKAPLFINGGDKDSPIRYSIKEHPMSKVYFSIMLPNQSFDNGVIVKTYDVSNTNEFGDIIIYVSSRETLRLQLGKHFYLIKIKMDDGEINTITDKEVLYVR